MWTEAQRTSKMLRAVEPHYKVATNTRPWHQRLCRNSDQTSHMGNAMDLPCHEGNYTCSKPLSVGGYPARHVKLVVTDYSTPCCPRPAAHTDTTVNTGPPTVPRNPNHRASPTPSLSTVNVL